MSIMFYSDGHYFFYVLRKQKNRISFSTTGYDGRDDYLIVIDILTDFLKLSLLYC